LLCLLHFSEVLRFTWIAPTDVLVRYGAEDATAGTDDGISSNFYTRGDEAVGGDPGSVADGDRPHLQPERWIMNIVASGAEVAFLRNDTMFSDGDSIQTIEHDIIPDPTVVSDGNFPGVGKASGGANHDAFADGGTEETQEKAPRGVKRVGREGKKNCLEKPPEENDPVGFSLFEASLMILA